MRVRNSSRIITTPEQIVRDFRRAEGFDTYAAARTIRPLCRKIRKLFFLVRWFKAVNWDMVCNWACIVATIACLVYLGIFVFGTFAIRTLR